MLNGLRHRCLYATTEETREHVAATASRIGAASDLVSVITERDLNKILAEAQAVHAQTIAIDTIQKLYSDVGAQPGSPTQLKKCVERLVSYAKDNDTAIWLVGHVTQAGDIAGPRAIEHSVDVTLQLELELEPSADNERTLRCAGKNRFGSTSPVGRFELTKSGFVTI
jgi:DNA repair protein RadA/Sms